MFSFSAFLSRIRPQRRVPLRTQRGRRRATALVETALCLTFVLLPVTLGGFQLAMVFITSHALQQITRESVRWAAVHYSEDTFDGPVTQGDKAGEARSLNNFIRAQAAANGIAWGDINGNPINKTPAKPAGQKGGSIAVSSTRTSGQPFTITITYPMRQRAFLGALFFKSDDGKNLAPLQLGFLQSDWTEASTTLLE